MSLLPKFSLFLLFATMIAVACTGGGGSGFSSGSSPASHNVLVSFPASKETAVKTGGGYKIYVGTMANFSLGVAVKTVDLSGSSAVNGQIQATITGLTTGSYFAKIQSYSNLIDPNTSSPSVSALSDEVSFNVP